MSDYRVDTQVNFDEMNNRVRFEIRRTVNALTLRLQRIVQEDMLSGQRLKVQSGRLRGSVSSKVDEDKDSIEGTVGAGGALVPYAPAHEFGLNGALGVKAHLRTIKQALADLYHRFRSILRPIQGMFGLENCGSCVIHWISWPRLCRKILMQQLSEV